MLTVLDILARAAFVWSHDGAPRQLGLDVVSGDVTVYSHKCLVCFDAHSFKFFVFWL